MRITIGIASTTHVDAHNERMSRAALFGMAEQIRSRYIPQLIEHDQTQQIGVVLHAKVIKLDDGEFALFVVTGAFDNDQERCTYKSGANNTVWRTYQQYLDNVRAPAAIGAVNKEDKPVSVFAATTDQQNVANMLERYFDFHRHLDRWARI